MEKLTGVDINISVYMEILGGHNIYQAGIRYEANGSVFEEIMTFSNRDDSHLVRVFQEVLEKINELENNPEFGKHKRIGD